MNIYYDIDKAHEIVKPVVTVGTFDGIHVAHRQIIDELNNYAEKIGGQSTLITFFPHPRQVLQPTSDFKYILTQNEKIELLKQTSLKNLIIINFDLNFAKTNYQDFVVNYLVNKLNISAIVLGFDHHFGKNREGNNELLSNLGEKYNFRVKQISDIKVKNHSVSSTAIRDAIMGSEIKKANELLGYEFFVTEKLNFLEVVDEKHIKFSIYVADDKVMPQKGVFLVNINYGDDYRKGVLIINPMDNTNLIFTKNTPKNLLLNKRLANIVLVKTVSENCDDFHNFINKIDF
ncbi:MAG: FAD synthetase family protein [Bacteroidales bacterium]